MAVSYNKMSAIQVAGTYINNIASGTSLGNVSLDVTGKSHFTGDMIVDGSFNILNINSSNIAGNFGVANNQTTGNINIGDALTTGTININSGASSTAPINISNLTTLNAPITIGSTTSTTQTLDINAITTFSKIASCSVAPTTSNHLCNKNYVDNAVGGGSILATNNTFTGTNAFNTSLPTSTLTPSSSTELTTKNYVDNAVSGVSILGTNNTFTGTNAFNTSLPTSTLTPSSSTELTTKSYVDSAVSGGSILGTNNTFTGTNNFKDVVYVNNPSATKTLTLKSTNQNITITTGASNQQSSGASFNCNTISVPVDNTENLITITIPFNVAGYGSPQFYPAGTITLTYSSFSINILKNGASYSGSSPSATLYNYETFINEWSVPSGTNKSPIFSALLGNINIPVSLDIGNTSTDTYTINLTITGTATHSSGGIYTLIFNVLTIGATNFTTTYFNNQTAPYTATFLDTTPTYIAYAKLLGDNGIYLSANNTLNLQSSSTIEFLTNTNFNSVLPQSTLTPLANADLATKIYIDNAISSAINSITPSTNPIGTIIMRASSSVPSGYLYCDGTTYNTTAYAGLWSVIFYDYGGSGSNFKVPDFRACFIRGAGSQTISSITYTAAALGTAQQDSVLSLSTISHQGYWSVDSGGGGITRQVKARSIITGDPVDTTSGIAASFTRQNTTENRPVNHAVYYYIKF
jgi:microcystin-dependent protein